MQEIELPDGTVLEFPDGMTDGQIREALSQYQPSTVTRGAGSVESPEAAYAAAEAASQAVADDRAGRLRDPSLFGRAADLARPFAQGATMGFGDEIVAGGTAAMKTAGDGFEGFGDQYDTVLGQERNRFARFEEANPVLSPALETGGAIATAMTPVGAIGSTTTGSALGALNLLRAAGAGAGYGAVYGYGTGEGGAENRAKNAPDYAELGAAGGVAGNLLQAGAGALGRSLARRSAEKTGAKQLGVNRPAFNVARQAAANADADITGAARPYLQQGGPDAMLGDIMPGQLDYVANVGAGAPIARRNLGARVDRATRDVDQALDTMFGQPQGVRQTARDIGSSTQALRKSAYREAMNSPIDYSDLSKVQIVDDALDFIPDDELASGLRAANKMMVPDYGKRAVKGQRQQIEFNIADDGSVELINRPSIEQMDYLKRAFQEKAESARGEFGQATRGSRFYDRMASNLRKTLLEVSPTDANGVSVYQKAMDAGADKIKQEQALELGQTMLNNRRITPEQVAEFMDNAGPAERQRAAQGVRAYLDNVLGNVKPTRTDPNIDQREASKAILDIPTRNNQDKIEAIYGPGEADYLFNELKRAARSFRVRANVAGNSATAARQATGRQIEQEIAGFGAAPEQMRQPNIMDSLLSVPGRAYNAATGKTPKALERSSDVTRQQLAELLTGRTGDSALQALDILLRQNGAAQAIPQNALQAQLWGRAARLASPPAAAPLIQP